MSGKCVVYCLNETCTYRTKGPTIFGICTHPLHQNLRPENVKHLLLETCPWKNPPQRLGYIPKERFVTAMPPSYIIPAKGAPGTSPYKIAHQMLTKKHYRPISEEADILMADSLWNECSTKSE